MFVKPSLQTHSLGTHIRLLADCSARAVALCEAS